MRDDTGHRGSWIIIGRDDSLNVFCAAASQNRFDFLFRVADAHVARTFVPAQILQGRSVIVMEKRVPAGQCGKFPVISMRRTDTNDFAHFASSLVAPKLTRWRSAPSDDGVLTGEGITG